LTVVKLEETADGIRSLVEHPEATTKVLIDLGA
jgi:hypothetical protein